jgi:3-dehydroquinate synthase class II
VHIVVKCPNPVQICEAPRANHEQPRISAIRLASGKEDRQWWFDARGLGEAETSVLDAAYQSGCSAILLNLQQQDRVMTAKHRIVYVEHMEQLEQLAPDVWILTPSEEVLTRARQAGRKAGYYIQVDNLESQFARCREVVQRGYDFVVIEMHHATYIPFELLLAEAEALPTRILRVVPIQGLQGTVEEVHQALNAFGTMESGVDVLFRSSSPVQIKRLDSRIEEVLRGRMQLVEAEVMSVKHTGLGHRVCVDTTTLMTAEEGMIVGSTGWGGIFVCSETHYLPHMNLREFRINAGGVHSYIWGPNNVALYLSELQSGSRALAVDVEGRTRVVTVGRVKIERRPLLLIRARLRPEDPPEAYIKTFLQNDWHVRVMGADHKVRNSTLVRPGDQLLAFADEPGRHTGLRVAETIVEK